MESAKMKLTPTEVSHLIHMVATVHPGSLERISRKLDRGVVDPDLLGEDVKNTPESRNLIQELIEVRLVNLQL